MILFSERWCDATGIHSSIFKVCKVSHLKQMFGNLNNICRSGEPQGTRWISIWISKKQKMNQCCFVLFLKELWQLLKWGWNCCYINVGNGLFILNNSSIMLCRKCSFMTTPAAVSTARHWKSSKPSAVTFMGNLRFLQIESLNFRN